MRVFSTRRNTCRQVRRFIVASAAVFIAACGDDEEASDTTAVGSATTSAATTTNPAATTAPTPATSSTTIVTNTTATTLAISTTTAPESEPIEWVPTGPGDPLIPRQYGGLLPQGDSDCEDLRRGPDGESPGSFWDVARQVCLAVTTGAEWPAADTAPEPPDADGPFASCLDQEVRAVIDAALEWHKLHPDRQPDVSYADAGALSACERPIYGLTAVLVGEQDFDGGSVGDVRIEFEIPSRPDLDADEIDTEVDGEQVSLALDGVDPDRGTRDARIILGGHWADGQIATVVLRSAIIERRGDVELPLGESDPNTSDGEPDSSPTTTT